MTAAIVPEGRPPDRGRSAVYEAERLLLGMFARGDGARSVQLAGTTLQLPPERVFADLSEVDAYVAEVLSAPEVIERYRRASRTVRVRARRGSAAAHYDIVREEIAVPDSPTGSWAMRELIILHELAHHLDESADAPHGHGFLHVLVDLVGIQLGPQAQLAYRVILHESGVL